MMSEDVIKTEMLSQTIDNEVNLQNLQCARNLALPDVTQVKTETPEESGSGKGSQDMSDMTWIQDAGTFGMTQSQWTGLPERDLPQTLIGKMKEESDVDLGTVQLTTGETYRIKRCLSPTALERHSRRPRSAQVIQHDMAACSQMADQQHTTDFLALFGTDNMMLQEVTDMEQNVLIPGKCEDFDRDLERNEFAYQQLRGSRNDTSDGEAMPRKHLDSSPGTLRKFSQMSSAAEDHSSKFGAKWSDDLRCYPVVPPFTGEPGLKCLQELGEEPSPLSFFQLFITNDVVKNIKEETNRYAYAVCKEKHSNNNQNARNIIAQWTPTSESEIKCFLAICLHMGLVHLRRIDDYWSDSSSLKTVYARTLMKRDRFKAILSFLHLNDNTTLVAAGEEGHDSLHKIRPVYDHLRCVFKSLYVPEQDISICEIICPWKGRGEMNACGMDAPSECGMQIHEVCENSSGYVYDFEVQAGERGESTSSTAVCYRLLTPLKNKGYTVFMGSYYCCPALAEKLASEDVMVVGICCKHRLGMPVDLQQSVLQMGEQMYRRKGRMLALKWHQDDDVYVLTTVHRPVMVHVKSGTQDGIQPAALVSFRKNMARVDRSSQVFGFMPAYCHTLKWWKKLFFYLLTLTVMQAHTLHSKYLKTKCQKPWLVDRFWKRLLEEMGSAFVCKE